jgi:hypothetical protein
MVHGLLNSSKIQTLLPDEQQVVALVNGTRAYGYDLEMENIAHNHFDFRSAGSIGANETANWIKGQFESFGLEAWLEPFEFTNWTLLDKPSLIIDQDGNQSTTNDQVAIGSFQCEHYSCPTPSEGLFRDLVILPLPNAADHTKLGQNPIDTATWNSVDITDKILLIGREVRMTPNWVNPFINKLYAQRPAAVLYTWWYSWMSFVPPFFSSAGGVPMNGRYYWDLTLPVGFVNYNDGLWIRNSENANANVAARPTVHSVINSNGVHYNVVGKIAGYEHPENLVIISSHYDTVMCNGFCDNGAGTAGIIELARVFAEAAKQEIYKPSYTLLFVAFTAEELFLVGSAHYVKQHKNDMANITAVINLDCIGSDDLYVSQTPGSDLEQKIIQAAQDLGLSAAMESPGGSDHESFMSPSDVNYMVLMNWGVDLGISDATPVASSSMIISYPLLYNDLWNMGEPGWIHTSYDNSTSTATMSWVDAEDLGNHIKVAALAIMRISPNVVPEFPSSIVLVLFVSIIFFICVLLRKKIRPPKLTTLTEAKTSLKRVYSSSNPVYRYMQ